MSFYYISLVISISVNALLTYYKRTLIPVTSPKVSEFELVQQDEEASDAESDLIGTTAEEKWVVISRQYLTVYGLAVGADWLQGSFVYALYKHDYRLPQSLIAALFATGFGAGAISATGIGYVADRFGRKKACLAYCIIYIASNALTMVNHRFALFLGRALGGVSTTLLYSVFETWMIAKASTQANSNALIQATLASAASINAVVAICAGLISEVLASVSGSKKAPFAGAIICLVLAASMMGFHWEENYGRGKQKAKVMTMPRNRSDDTTSTRIHVVIITIVTCFMESSMYVMVFFWTPSLDQVRPALVGEAPYGIIFASFMAAMMSGSWLFSFLTKSDSSTLRVSQLIQGCVSISSICFLLGVLSMDEKVRFLAFCAFEFSLGLYFPSIGLLKSQLVDERNRGFIYGLMRLPLNVFVTSVLCTTREDDSYRQNRFILCGELLICSSILLSPLFFKIERK